MSDARRGRLVIRINTETEIRINDSIVLKVVSVSAGRVRIGVVAPPGVLVRRLSSALGSISFPEAWQLLSYLLPAETRQRVWEPALEDCKAHYVQAVLENPIGWRRRWVTVAFLWQTFLMIGQCLPLGVWCWLRWAVRLSIGWIGVDHLARSIFGR